MATGRKPIGLLVSLVFLVILFFERDFIAELIGVLLTDLLIFIFLLLLYSNIKNYRIVRLNKKAAKRFTKVHPFSHIASFSRKILFKAPTLVWGMFAVLGILMVGIYLGYNIASIPDKNSAYAQITDNNHKLLNLVKGYEDIERLYYLEGQDLGVIVDPDMIQNYPNEVSDALKSIKVKRDYVNIQYGRILELRRQANLPETPESKTN